jgi:HEAT repeat protein
VELSVALAGRDDGWHPSYAEHTQSAVNGLREHGVTTLAELLDTFSSLPDEQRADGAYILGRLGRKRDVARLIAHFGEERSQAVKQAIVDALATIGGERAYAALVAWLADPNHPGALRFAACHALTTGPGRTESTVDVLLNVATSAHEDPLLRGQALEAVSQIVGMDERRDCVWQRTVDAHLACLRDPAGEVRFWAIYGVGQLHAEGALPELQRLVESDDFLGSMGWENREEARDVIHYLTTGELLEPDAFDRATASRSTPCRNSSDS